jgi:hypothetical protein
MSIYGENDEPSLYSHSALRVTIKPKSIRTKPKSIRFAPPGCSADTSESNKKLLGFGSSQSTRDAGRIDNHVPPPGHYYDERLFSSVRLNSPSESRRGYISGLISTNYNRDKYLKDSVTRNTPSYYDVPGAIDSSPSTTNRLGNTLPFLGSPAERVPFPKSRSESPGPNNYKIFHDIRGPNYIRRKNNAVFVSSLSRDSVLEDALRRR